LFYASASAFIKKFYSIFFKSEQPGQEWAGTQRLYGEKVFKILPGKDIIRVSSVLKKIIENLRLFEPWEHHLVEKVVTILSNLNSRSLIILDCKEERFERHLGGE